MGSLFSFFGVLLAAVLFSQLFSRMKVPWVVGLILGGILIGPSGFGVYEADPSIEFFALLGLIFLMFMAGLESHLTDGRGLGRQIIFTGILGGLLPAILGANVVLWLGYPLPTAILIGIVFMSSAIALLIPQFQAQNLLSSELGRLIVLTAMSVDGLSLILLALFIQGTLGSLSTGLLLLYIGLFGLLWLFAKLVPKLRLLAFAEDYAEQQDLYEKELRLLVLVLVGFVILFELIGLHAIVASFFVGVIFSGSLKSRLLKAKLHALGYGFLIPIFFITVGASVDLGILFNNPATFFAVAVVVGTLIISKFIGGCLAGITQGFNNPASLFIGASMLPQLSTSLAVTFLGFSQGLLDEVLLAAVIVASILTAVIAPFLVKILDGYLSNYKIVLPEAHPETQTDK